MITDKTIDDIKEKLESIKEINLLHLEDFDKITKFISESDSNNIRKEVVNFVNDQLLKKIVSGAKAEAILDTLKDYSDYAGTTPKDGNFVLEVLGKVAEEIDKMKKEKEEILSLQR